ncbi:MAG: hypothetical protein Pg6C_01110 [Treponemataceae bacterium]|nr:MAG: hypothetical protein Pg6C_01110 [Treponemataceae bacterium]
MESALKAAFSQHYRRTHANMPAKSGFGRQILDLFGNADLRFRVSYRTILRFFRLKPHKIALPSRWGLILAVLRRFNERIVADMQVINPQYNRTFSPQLPYRTNIPRRSVAGYVDLAEVVLKLKVQNNSTIIKTTKMKQYEIFSCIVRFIMV